MTQARFAINSVVWPALLLMAISAFGFFFVAPQFAVNSGKSLGSVVYLDYHVLIPQAANAMLFARAVIVLIRRERGLSLFFYYAFVIASYLFAVRLDAIARHF